MLLILYIRFWTLTTLNRKNLKIIITIICLFISYKLLAKTNRLKISLIKNKEYVSTYDLIKIFNIDNSFDTVLRRSKLYKKNHYSVYVVGFSYILIDGELFKSKYPVYQKNGEIFLPLYFTKLILKKLYPEYSVKFNKNIIYAELKKEVIPKKITKNKNTVKDRIGFIVIDSGHGGKDPGAIGKGGI